jgi:phenylalanyl-tRNA synthetase alpha chain
MSPVSQDITEQLKNLQSEAQEALTKAQNLDEVETLRIQFLGRKEGRLTAIKRGLKDIPDTDRPAIGALANVVSDTIESLLDARVTDLKRHAVEAQLGKESLDVTMPGTYLPTGQRHPLTLVTDEVVEIFMGMGFTCIDDDVCPEVETEYYNFEALNFPPDHPARDMQDTFYTNVGEKVLLRSQTSNAQIRFMEHQKPPIRVVAPGRVYRNEEVSSRKGVLFHQIEGLLVDEKTNFSDLKGTLHQFVKLFFGKERPTRFRNSFFPFTEPSAEVDVECILCNGKGCRTCGHHGWLEILGAGMVDPNVLKGVGIDPEKYQGFAFGMGVERLAMLKYSIRDLRMFYNNDVRFLRQFKG